MLDQIKNSENNLHYDEAGRPLLRSHEEQIQLDAEDRRHRERGIELQIAQRNLRSQQLVARSQLFLLILGLIGLYFNYRQAKISEEAAWAAKDAANVAHDSLDYSASQFDRTMKQIVMQTASQNTAAQAAVNAANTDKEALHLSERAFIVTSTPTAGGPEVCQTGLSSVPCVKVHLHNIGRTPAVSVLVNGFLDINGRPDYPAPSLPTYDGLTGIAIGVDSDNTETLYERNKKSVTDMYMIRQNDRRALAGYSVSGYVQYKDIFGDSQTTAFCYFLPYSPNSDSPPRQCPHGNWFGTPRTTNRKR